MKTLKVTLKNRINRFLTALVIVGDFRDDRIVLDNNTVPFIQSDAWTEQSSVPIQANSQTSSMYRSQVE
jgi:hypothetical protein